MLLILMCHAEAGEADSARWPDDRRRPLRRMVHLRPAVLLRPLDPAGPPATISLR